MDQSEIEAYIDTLHLQPGDGFFGAEWIDTYDQDAAIALCQRLKREIIEIEKSVKSIRDII